MKEAIKILKYHQKWRQGADIEMKYTPQEITKALDELLEQFEGQRKCPNCESVDYETMFQCNDCPTAFDETNS